MCRHAREVGLDDGGVLRYDLLVLAPGLHNATLSAVKAGGVAGVCSADELRQHLTAADAEALRGALVYGDTLAAVSALATLQACGVDAAQTVLHLAPPGAPGAGVAIMREVHATLSLSPSPPPPLSAVSLPLRNCA